MFAVVTWAIKGDPFSAITVYGPFHSEGKARRFAEQFGVHWRLARWVKAKEHPS